MNARCFAPHKFALALIWLLFPMRLLAAEPTIAATTAPSIQWASYITAHDPQTHDEVHAKASPDGTLLDIKLTSQNWHWLLKQPVH